MSKMMLNMVFLKYLKGAVLYVPGFLLVIGATIPQVVCGQTGSTTSDSLKSYDLSGIVVGAEQDSLLSRQSVRRIRLVDLDQQHALSAAGLVRLIPSAFLQTNSRGESLIYIRNSGERQVAIFLDGALINVPWDNRADLSMIPGSVVGGFEVSVGAPSVRFGPNAIGGAVNILPRNLARQGSLTEVQIQAGSVRTGFTSGTFMSRSDRSSILVSGAYSKMNGAVLSTDHALEYSQDDPDVRTNTDRRLGNLYLRFTRVISESWNFGLSMLHVNGRKGVAPEGHISPETDPVRFWRYPDWTNSMLIINAAGQPAGKTIINATGWLGRFAQRINSYASANYDIVVESEDGLDRSVGGRVLSTTRIPSGSINFALHFATSGHRDITTRGDQTDASFNYRQNLYSVGAEYGLRLSDNSEISVGASLDGAAFPETGDKPAHERMSALAFTGSFETLIEGGTSTTESGPTTRFSARFGKKSRFPTMRELFGESLETFVLNPNLKPESAWLADVTLGRSSFNLSGEMTLFARRTVDTIDRINVVGDGVKKRLRVNLNGSRVFGAEVIGRVRIATGLVADAHFMWTRSTALLDEGSRHLNEKPDVLSTISFQYSMRWGGSLRATGQYTGLAYSLAPDNTQISLPTSLVLNLRMSLRRYFRTSLLFVEFYAGVNNVGDVLALPQAGLPAPGREWLVGLSTSI
ncbi:MAG: hypothetical protein E2O84_02940 [Bacteroidetes bacterium]|nr:MAG: hypothetical protein E2O84_02940 [Bacteroidota bacterium]